MSDANMIQIRHTIGAHGILKLRNVSGRMRLVGTDGGDAVVRVTAGRGQPQLSIERTPDGLVVEPEKAAMGGFQLHVGGKHSLDFEVELPRGARLDVKTVSADIDARELAGEQAYKTVSGDVRLADVAGRISVMTVSGDVRLHGGQEVEIDAATTSGDLTVEAQVVRKIGARTVSGDVRLAARLAPGSRHSVETVSGDLLLDSHAGVTVESSRALDFARKNRPPTVIGDGAARLLFRSMSGEERVRAGAPTDGATPRSEPAPEPRDRAPLSADERLAVLQALERGEIDVDEASRRLQGAAHG